jgi:hypothetical protein
MAVDGELLHHVAFTGDVDFHFGSKIYRPPPNRAGR